MHVCAKNNTCSNRIDVSHEIVANNISLLGRQSELIIRNTTFENIYGGIYFFFFFF